MLQAYENTVARTGKIAFGYMDKILESWYRQGIKTAEQARQETKPSQQQPSGGQAVSKMIWDKFLED